MSGSFESMRWNACVHRLDLGLYSHPKVRTHVNSKGKKTRLPQTPLPPPPKKKQTKTKQKPTTTKNKNKTKQTNLSSEEDRTYGAASTGQRVQHTSSELFRPLLKLVKTGGFPLSSFSWTGLLACKGVDLPPSAFPAMLNLQSAE